MNTNVFTPPSQISYIEGAVTLGIHIRNTTELIQELEQGLESAVATRLAKHMRLPLEGFFTQAGIPSRSIKTALKTKSRLSTEKSEIMYRLGRIFERTLKVFHGNEEKAARWMVTPKFGLNNETPLKYARTEPGGESVLELLEEIIDGGVA
jgi:putative toxin-antitoxin system antitoxin component (TIGR02293 family)